MTRRAATPANGVHLDYSARTAYADYEAGVDYEKDRFRGLLGRYRWRREQAAVALMIGSLPRDLSILDCPCGTGRWWPALAKRAREIVAVDISPGMLEHASQRAAQTTVPVQLIAGDAEEIPLGDGTVDVAFSFALMKHLPPLVQYRVLGELARVARSHVICTFGVLDHLSYEFWRRRHLNESYPLLPEELSWMAEASGLSVERRVRCTTPIGTEHLVMFSRI